MSGGMYLAAAGALVQQLRLEVLANNVANISTIGYKGDQSIFRIPEEIESQTFQTSIEGIQSLSPYAPPFSTVIDFSQGAIRQTGNPLDVAINGDGFFSIQTPDGVQYTRQGSFSLNADGVLVTSDGYPVMGEGGEISLEEGTVEIDMEGGVYVDGDEVGRLQITDFSNTETLKKAGNGRFVGSDASISGKRPENTSLSQGYLETGNVNPVRAMTEMIETSRAFEAYQKVIQSADEATSKSINDVGKGI
ncbi:flagellar basal-body rod protein FlgF [uncultured Desulfosarcina sp.]|uniref:flagellar basal-body rod protein FlgF n=1 Tax=uncultured Desulfosarcina sp. TaxID=218289 RepID=UPI0029C6442E|nr:flagellar basal-body rod protein FlgF [uncultured Desulfosarcina sp.]